MIINTKEIFFARINELYQAKIPFFFITDYEIGKMEVATLSELKAIENLWFQGPELSYPTLQPMHLAESKPLEWRKWPISYEQYLKSFLLVKEALQKGLSYLVNLTCSTRVETNYSLAELYALGVAKYKLYYRDRFVHFSPEPFFRIKNGCISSFPMKGTIEENELGADQSLLLSEKETREQYTIVDLIRNDLQQVAFDVEVESFRYLEKLKTNQKNLYTMSSHITGKLRENYLNCPGDVLASMLPAGSITGAPKKATKLIISNAETHDRNYYTGVWGYFNGALFDCCVIIRYLERSPEGFTFKSGGGITSLSDPVTEYQEMLAKVYVPLP